METKNKLYKDVDKYAFTHLLYENINKYWCYNLVLFLLMWVYMQL